MSKMKFLNIGCGHQYHSDWHNLDFVSTGEGVQAHNLLEGIPYDNDYFEVVYHSHLLEHFTKKDGLKLIKECYRVLSNNGTIRVVVPDLEGIVKMYLNTLNAVLEDNSPLNKSNYEWSVIELFDQMVREKSGGNMLEYWKQETILNEDFITGRMGQEFVLKRQKYDKNNQAAARRIPSKKSKKSLKRLIVESIFKRDMHRINLNKKYIKLGKFRQSGEIHKWMYDRYSLKILLEEVGFKKVKIKDAFTSDVKNWGKFGLDVVDGKIRKPDSLFVEATK
mgnify:CR=1 FL=1